jgi:23S rRNA pseudouridine1911/1915/1917 synthase
VGSGVTRRSPADALKILFEDNHVIAVEKPPGILSQADATGGPDLLTLIKKHIKARDSKTGNVFLGLVHRLDRNAGGAMVFAKTSKAAARLSSQIRDRTFEKAYLAVVVGRPEPPRGRLEHILSKDARENVVRVLGAAEQGVDHADASPADGALAPEAARGAAAAARGQRAVLEYETLATRESASLVRVRLVTGRAHQIRAQFAAIGAPLVGDRKYGAQDRSTRTGAPTPIALWSMMLRFRHPTRDEDVVIRSAPPSRGPWAAFASDLSLSLESER